MINIDKSIANFERNTNSFTHSLSLDDAFDLSIDAWLLLL